MTDENIEKLLKVIKSFGFGSLGLNKSDFSDADNIIQLGYEPYRIDLLMDVNGVDFETCYNLRTDGEIEGVKVKFGSTNNLAENEIFCVKPSVVCRLPSAEK